MLIFAHPESPDLAARPPRCLKCAYILQGLEEPRCPECGLTFDPLNRGTYTRKPAFIYWRYHLPGVCLALGGGLLLTAAFLSQGVIGWGLVLAVPFSIGGLLGYAVRAKVRAIVLLTLGVIVAVVTTMVMAELAGIFCGLILAALFSLPALFGIACGSILRHTLKTSRFSQRWYLPVLGFLLVPPLTHAAERLIGFKIGPESVATSRVVHVPVERVWNSHLFQDGQAVARPPLMAVGLPHPLEPQGPHAQVGNLKVCRFSKGTLAVRITEREENRVLAFAFVGQNHVEDRAIRLIESRFDFEELGPNQARVTITTRYQPLMTPRWYWRPFETWSGESTHNYLLEEMNRDATKSRQASALSP